MTIEHLGARLFTPPPALPTSTLRLPETRYRMMESVNGEAFHRISIDVRIFKDRRTETVKSWLTARMDYWKGLGFRVVISQSEYIVTLARTRNGAERIVVRIEPVAE